VHFGDPEIASLKGNFHEAYLLQFLDKPSVEKAQLGVFGCSEAIGAIYFHFEHCKAHILAI
jgi:hypothetical protein